MSGPPPLTGGTYITPEGAETPPQLAGAIGRPDHRPRWVKAYRRFWRSVLATVTEVSVLMTIGLTLTAAVTTLALTGVIGDEWLYIIPTWWTAVSGWGAIYYGRKVNRIGPTTTRHAVSTPMGSTIPPGMPVLPPVGAVAYSPPVDPLAHPTPLAEPEGDI